MPSLLSSASKRKLSDENDDEERLMSPLSEDSMETNSPSQTSGREDTECVSHPAQKKVKDSSKECQTQQSSSQKSFSVSEGMNCPLPGETGTPCLVKVYNDADSFKLNDVVEFVGVLSVDPVLGYQDQ